MKPSKNKNRALSIGSWIRCEERSSGQVRNLQCGATTSSSSDERVQNLCYKHLSPWLKPVVIMITCIYT